MSVRVDEDYWVKKPKKSSVDTLRKRNYTEKTTRNFSSEKKNNSPPRSVVKVTSGAKDHMEVANHIDYISRNGKLELHTSDNKTLKGKDQTITAKNEMAFQNEKLSPANIGKNKTKQTYNIVFSLKNHSGNSKEALLRSVENTMKEKFPDNYFVYALHEDTDHPHVHVCMNKKNIELQKNINLNKSLLQELKYTFSRELIRNGIDVKLEAKKRQIDKEKNQTKMPTGVFKMVAHGRAPFNDNQEKNVSYFVAYKTNVGKIVKVWGQGLEKAIQESGAKVGDFIKLKKTSIDNQKVAHWQIKIHETKQPQQSMKRKDVTREL